MPKQLISIIGVIVTLGVIALAVQLIALPMWVQSLAVDTQPRRSARMRSMLRLLSSVPRSLG
jgi:hypothetical protein